MIGRPKIIITLILFLLAMQCMLAQPPKRFYTKFGGNGVDIGNSGIQIPFKRYIVLGSTTSSGSGGADVKVLLLDSMGKSLWERNYGGTGMDVGKRIIYNLSDSGFVFTGYTSTSSQTGYDILVGRLDKNGELIWQNTFGTVDWDFGNDLIFSDDGHIIVCGVATNGPYGKSDGCISKLNISTGALMWQKWYGGSHEDEFLRIKKTSDGYYTLFGNTRSYGDTLNDFWICKININGDSIVSKKIGQGSRGERGYDFIQDNDNNLVMCGAIDTSVVNSGRNVAYVIKADVNGDFIKDFRHAGSAFTDDDKFVAITNIYSGKLYGLSRKVLHTPGIYGIDIQPIVCDYNFIIYFANTYGDAGEDEAFQISATSDNGFLVTGTTHGFGAMSTDIFLVKLEIGLDSAISLVSTPENLLERHLHPYYNEKIVYMPRGNLGPFFVEILNIAGKTVFSSENVSNDIRVDLISGIYIARIRTKCNKLFTFKFVTN